ncbi:MAG: hypothetical protein SRB1_00831 [Desulfobacteraceae bacterium Eth-SRB1]|nr:MAG: hypothetical protein SRB1_00831 [Desulfobacteraceae bacterium Eth-SRB1]
MFFGRKYELNIIKDAIASNRAELGIVYGRRRIGKSSLLMKAMSRDIRNELTEVKGFSKRNIGYMIRFAREYDSHAILQQPVAKLAPDTLSANLPQPVVQLSVHKNSENLQQLVAKIPWGHHILLMEKIKDLPARLMVHASDYRTGMEPECAEADD